MIRKAKKSDIKLMVELSYQKRLSYAKAKPNFWKMAESSNEIQANLKFLWSVIKPYKWCYLLMMQAPIVNSFYKVFSMLAVANKVK